MVNLNSDDTVEVGPSDVSRGDRPVTASSRVQVDVAGLSHIGLIREHNEDHYLVVRFGRFLDSLSSNLPPGDVDYRFSETGYGFIVADGMGGHAAGDEASRFAINVVLDLVLKTSDWILRFDSDAEIDRALARAKERFELASQAMTDEAAFHPRLAGFATTLTLAASVGQNLFVAHVGDSRAYLFRDRTLHQLTPEHTVAQELVDAGMSEQDVAALSKFRRCITRSLGDNAVNSEPSVRNFKLAGGDVLLLCSDGLTNMVDDAQIAETLRRGETAEMTSHRLVEQALAAGGRDNVTVIVARYEFPPLS